MATDLVERAQHGDHEAFDALASAAYDRLFAIASRILRDPYAAEDAVQEALVRAWRDLRGLRERDRFDAWLHRLLVRACADQGRRAKRQRAEISAIDLEPPEPADDVARLADRDELQRAFLELSVDHRSVLVLVHYVGLSAPEVATILGIPAGTVYSRLHYGTRQMREILERPPSLATSQEHGR